MNYDVHIRIDKTIYAENVDNEQDAINNAIAHMQNLLIPGIEDHISLIKVRASMENPNEEILDEEQIKNIQKISLELSNKFNHTELKLLIEDLKFYIGI